MRNVMVTSVVACLVAVSLPAFSEPTPVIQYLMNEPVSMLDMGMMRIELLLISSLGDLGARLSPQPTVHVVYDWEKNRIVMEFFTPGLGFESEGRAKDWCRGVVDWIRLEFAVNTETGQLLGGGETSLFPTFFLHTGFSRGNEPRQLGAELDAVALIVIRVGLEGVSEAVLRCEAPLVGKDVLFLD